MTIRFYPEEYGPFEFSKYFKSCQYSARSAKMVFVRTWLVYFSFQDDFTITDTLLDRFSTKD